MNCDSCGSLVCFADDSSYSKSSKDTKKIKNELDDKYQDISNYMAMNKLVLNSDKTHLLVMCTEEKQRRHQNYDITLDTGAEVIEPIDSEKLLGGYISSNLKWNEHIRDNKKSVFKQLTSRVNALCKVCQVSPFKTRKMLANGMVMSSLIYLIQLWGGSSAYLLHLLQVIQNCAARQVTRLNWYTPTKTLLDQCGWLSVKQLSIYHSLVLVYKVKSDKKPVQCISMIDLDMNSHTIHG